MSLWREDLMMVAAIALILGVGKLDLEPALVTESIVVETDQARAQEPPLLRPVCPDQWVAMRGAAERWRVRCALASTEGSRVVE